MFLYKDVLKRCSKFTREHPCPSLISVKLLCSSIEITLWHGRSPMNLLHIFRTPFPRNTSRWLLLYWLIFVPTKIQQLSPMNLVTHSMPPISIYTPLKISDNRKNNLNFCFHTLCSLKRFYESLKDLKILWDTKKKCENKHLSQFLVFGCLQGV